MQPPRDAVTRAYAIIGLRPGTSGRVLKSHYKRLVKKWHPDRWTGDPVGQAEAAQRMRQINEAYALLHNAATGTETPKIVPSESRPRPIQPDQFGRPLSTSELDAIARAIRNESPVLEALGFLSWFGPMLAAYVPIASSRGSSLPPTTTDWLLSAGLFVLGASMLVRRTLVKRRQL
jgi:hypothetical protein